MDTITKQRKNIFKRLTFRDELSHWESNDEKRFREIFRIFEEFVQCILIDVMYVF